MIQLIFQNLISNAINHHDAGRGTVQIECVPGDEHWTFSVTDDGPGIPSDRRERMCGIFQTSSAPDGYRGTGIGLAISRRLVERYGGSLRIGDNPAGRGARFEFDWPVTGKHA